ncbi:hypothetical protein CYJ25_03245 [Schaalia turicensis]|uniref:Uncharacterized protein n=1 Tax=Schaalia turicensis TaxID=131111 RepID=A0A2I1I619_9ACTO|nr:hypothetical protein CYJ25_03245 [Schaalia turicensis]
MAVQRHRGGVHAHVVRMLALLFVLVGFVLACVAPSFAQGDGKNVNSPFLKDSLLDTFTVLSSCSSADATYLIAIYLDGDGMLLQRSEPLVNPLTGEKLEAKVWAVGTYDAQKERFVATVEIPNGTNNADGTLWKANIGHQLTVSYLTKDGHSAGAACEFTRWVGITQKAIPITPVDPVEPATPVQPVDPVIPSEPEKPVTPGAPVVPEPVTPSAPATPLTHATSAQTNTAAARSASNPAVQAPAQQTTVASPVPLASPVPSEASSTEDQSDQPTVKPLSSQSSESSASSPSAEAILTAHEASVDNGAAMNAAMALSASAFAAGGGMVLIAGGVVAHLLSASAPTK